MESFVSEENDFVERVYTLQVVDYDKGGELNISVRNISPAFAEIKEMLEGKKKFRDVKYRFSFVLRPCILPYSDVMAYTAELCGIEAAGGEGET
jgi:hypothetical protein